jgi:phosphatidylserine/phosphatidylglycerophosphate/cardiolipin synthase-like enzyme
MPLYVHGAEYFRTSPRVEAARAGDRIFFTDWRGDSDERLTDAGPTIGELLCEAARRGVHVRSLLWRAQRQDETQRPEDRHLGAMIK